MGRKRKPEHLKKTTIFVPIPNPLFWHLEKISEQQNIKVPDLIVNCLNEKYPITEDRKITPEELESE